MHAYELTVATDRIIRPVAVGPFAICRSILLVIVGVCVLGSGGCGDGETTWTAQARSPDGNWLASARTVENGGFGTGAAQTIVYLKQTNVSSPPEAILSFFHDASPASQPGGTIHLTMRWETPSRLEVTYDGHANLSFQVVKYGGIDISVRDLSSVEARSPDRYWLASARTTRSFGAGTPGEETNVYLERIDDSRPPERVLGFSHDATASRSGTINPALKWVTPSHLEVAYDGHAKLDFQVAKYGDVDISLRDLSRVKIKDSQ
jgi:hypothetical protein